MDSEYLKNTVGLALAQGLAEIVSNRPHDSVEYLGYYLLKHGENLEKEEATANRINHEAKQVKVVKEKAQLVANDQLLQEEKEKADQISENTLRDHVVKATDIDTYVGSGGSLLGQVLEIIKSKTGAAGAYIGIRETIKNEDGNDIDRIKYIAATADHDFMLHETLNAGTGITWDSLKEPEPVEGEEENGGKPKERQPLYIENILAQQNAHFFRVPKIGSFLATPFKVKTFLYEGAVDDLAGAHESAASAGDDEEQVEGAPPRPAESPEEKVNRRLIERIGKLVDGVLVIDSIGLDTPFNVKHQEYIKSWIPSIVKGLQHAELHALKEEREQFNSFSSKNAADVDSVEAKIAQNTAALEAAMSALGDDAKDADKKVKAAHLAVTHATENVGHYASLFNLLSHQRLPPNKLVLDAFTLVSYATGYQSKDIYDRNAKVVSWKLLRSIIGDTIVSHITKTYDVNAPHPGNGKPKYASLPVLKEKLNAIDVAALSAFAVPAGLAVTWLKTMIEYREAVDQKILADKLEAEAKAAAELAASEVPPTDDTN